MKIAMTEPTFDQKEQAKRDHFRMWLAVAYLFVFMPAWMMFLIILLTNFEMEAFEAIGWGTMNGVVWTAFALLMQFLYRRR